MQRLAEIILVVLEKIGSKFRQCIFAISLLFPLEKGVVLIYTNLNFFYSGILCVKAEIGPVLLEKIFILHQCFSLFHYHLPLRKGVVLDLNK